MKSTLEGIQGVIAAHSLHIWSLTVNKAALAVHLAVGMYNLQYTMNTHISLSICQNVHVSMLILLCKIE